MSTKFKPVLVLVLLACCPFVSVAQSRGVEPLADCVTLSSDHQLQRFGSQYLLVKDGEAYYRIGFGGSGCSAITLSSNLKIATEGQADRLCPADTRVITKRDSCAAREVKRVDENEYAKYVRKRR